MYVPDLAKIGDVSTAPAGVFAGLAVESADATGASLVRHRYATATSTAKASATSVAMIQPPLRVDDVAIVLLRIAF
jgi:hypothetical protein